MMQSSRAKRETIIGDSLVDRLKEAVQAVLQLGDATKMDKVSGHRNVKTSTNHNTSNNTNALCNVLEAILIHGLKDSLSEKMSLLLADPDRMPVPNFWPVVLTISHGDFIKQLSDLTYITSEVGKSRAWLRLALNQGQISWYMGFLAADNRTLKDYYRPTAFLRDSEKSDIMCRVMQPLSSLSFHLATNAAVLNVWTQTPLILAGLWTPTSESHSMLDPVLAGTDLASTVIENRSTLGGWQESSTPNEDTESPLNESMFESIIRGTPETNFIDDAMRRIAEVERRAFQDPKDSFSGIFAAKAVAPNENENGINNDELVSGLNFPQMEKDNIIEVIVNSRGEAPDVVSSSCGSHFTLEREDSMNQSVIDDNPEYDNLFSNYDLTGPYTSMPIMQLPESLNDLTSNLVISDNEESPDPEEAQNLNFVIVPHQPLNDEESQRLLPCLTRLTTEEGLDAQSYQCHKCHTYIGIIYGKPRMCTYDGKYYCTECHQGDMAAVPSRMIHNWDFAPHPVASGNALWLSAVSHLPLIDVRSINAKLYRHVDELAELQQLRTQLLYLCAYLFTCKSTAGDELRKTMWPNDHLYRHVHCYSISDLQQVRQGQLVPRVRQAVTFSRQHVVECQVCHLRGFVCEICHDREVIYPFQLETTRTCNVCYAVYHSDCIKMKRKCSRCLRRDARRYAEENYHENISETNQEAY